MAGLVPATHVFLPNASKGVMPGKAGREGAQCSPYFVVIAEHVLTSLRAPPILGLIWQPSFAIVAVSAVSTSAPRYLRA